MDLLMQLFLFLSGFTAELIDSALGMAYGVTSNSLLLLLGLLPAIASATVHTSEVVLTATSGLSHVKMGNFDRKLFLSLLLPGVISAVIGSYLLCELEIPGLKKAVAIYLIFIGVLLFLRTFGKGELPAVIPAPLLAAVAAFCDAVGGGGWGPIATGTLLAEGRDPPKVIGSVNSAEFFITTSEVAVFLLMSKVNWLYVLPFLLGGLPAAIIGAKLLRKIGKRRGFYIPVGILLIVTNIRNLM